jgi:geranylgeranyl diphosphate synthase type I
MVTVLRTADDVLSWARLLVDPPLRAAVGRLPDPSRDVAELQFGWLDEHTPPGEHTRTGEHTPRGEHMPTGEHTAAREHTPAGRSGKGLRPALTLVCAGAVGGDPHDAVPAAVAVELVHHWSAIRRDLVDGDITRRHRPTAWSVFGAQPAALGGEALLALAFEVAAAGIPTRTVPGPFRQATRELHCASGPTRPGTDRATMRILGDTVQQLLHGQHASLVLRDTKTGTCESTGQTDLLRDCLAMVEQRTGALFGCACALGAVAGGGDRAQVEQLRLFGVRLGLAVQFTEDLLGIWGDPAATGRPSYPDLRRRRRSLPVAAALAAGADELAQLFDRDDRLGDLELERAAKTIEQSGARAWCRQQAGDLLAQALLALDLAIPSPAAVAELVALARMATSSRARV